MENIEKRYERRGKAKPCFLSPDDLVALAGIIQETFTKPEVKRYFRVSTTMGSARIFSNSMEDFLTPNMLPDKISDLSFWIEGWDQKNRFDKNVLLDFSKYSVQLHVEGTDPVWVYDKYNKIMKFLKDKTAWYWPVITLEKFIIFGMTMILIASLAISFRMEKTFYYSGKFALLGIWTFLIFYDTRKIWPYSILRLRGAETAFSRENVFMVGLIAIVICAILEGVIAPLFR